MATKSCTLARDAETLDLFLDDGGNIALVEGKDAYAQIINARMRTTRGELILNTLAGLPYFTTVFTDPRYIPIWQSEVTRTIEELPFVRSIISFNCEQDGDVLKYEMKIETDEGTIDANG